jgi:dTDP-4-amino-4,6-dideoxygalactose transaminase
MASLDYLEQRLAEFTGRRHCVAMGRAATGLWLIMQQFHSTRRDKIVFPATLCLSPVMVARLCHLEPLFCDVKSSSGNLYPATLDELLSARSDICAVVAAHLYGQPADMVAIAAICHKHGTPLIEDVAQALGSRIGDCPTGSFGDVAVLSFGHTKILDAGDGGAIVTDDAALARDLRAQRDGLPPRPSQTTEWSEQYRRAYYAIAAVAQSQVRLRRLLGQLGQLFPELYRYALDSQVAERICIMLDDLDEEVCHRRRLAECYSKALAGLPIEVLDMESGGVPWRFSFTVEPSRRDTLLTALRSDCFNASAWYPAVPPFFGDYPDWTRRWPAAAHLEAGIVNLWVDRSTSEERALACCSAIARTFQ